MNSRKDARQLMDGPRSGWTVATACMAIALVMSAMASLNFAILDIATDISTAPDRAIWIADAFTLSLACLLLVGGALGDRFGRRRVLLAGLFLFSTASFAAAGSQSFAALVAWRTVAGVGAALIMPATLALITSALPLHRRARGVSIWAAAAGAGAILGLIGSGLLLHAGSWTTVFWASGAFAAAVFAAALFVPAHRGLSAVRIDLLGGALSAGGIGLLVLGVLLVPEHGWSGPQTWGAMAAGCVLLGGFVVQQSRAGGPLLDVSLFASRPFAAGFVSLTVQFLAAFGLFLALVLHLQVVFGFSPLRASFALFPMAAALVVASPAAPWLTRKLGLRSVTAVGLGVLALALLIMGYGDVASDYQSLVLPMALLGAGLGLSAPPATLAIVDDVPPSAQGVASAVNDLAREFGGAIGIALAGSLLVAELQGRAGGREGGIAPSTNVFDLLVNLNRADYVSAFERVATTLGLVVVAAMVLLCVLAPRRTAETSPEAPGPTSSRASVLGRMR